MTKPYAYEAEVMLLRWGDSSTAGRTITIELDPTDGEVHPFKGFPVGHKGGQRFRMRFDPILDDETMPTAEAEAAPVVAPAAKPADPSKSEKAKAVFAGLAPWVQDAATAGMMCKNHRFQQFLTENIGEDIQDEISATRAVKGILGVRSRSAIGVDADVNAAWKRLETDYDVWSGKIPEPR